MMRKALRSRKNQIRLIVVTAVMTGASLILLAVFNHLGGILVSQRAAERFQGESQALYAQVSAYFPTGSEIEQTSIYSFDQALESEYLNISMEDQGDGELYTQCYSAVSTVTVESEKASATVTAVGVGGDFFFFHPLTLRSGNYFDSGDLMNDYVLLDEDLAWRLFGGTDLVGLTVRIGDQPYVVAGVVSREDDFASKKAYNQGTGLYMSYDKLLALNEVKISAFEVVAANPIDGFVRSVVEKNFKDAAIIENSNRFSYFSIFKIIGSFAERSMNTTGAVLPYWENAARYVENIMAILLLFAVILAVFPLFVYIYAAVTLVRRAVAALVRKVPQVIDNRRERAYREKMSRKGGS